MPKPSTFWWLAVAVSLVALSTIPPPATAAAEDYAQQRRTSLKRVDHGVREGISSTSSATPASENTSSHHHYTQRHRSMFVEDLWQIVSNFILQLLGFDFNNEEPTPRPMPTPTLRPTLAPVAPTPTLEPNSPTTGAPAPPPTAPTPPTTTARCTCASCTDAVWNTDARGSTCGARIEYLVGFEAPLYPQETDACARVADVEYPTECGACDPARCDGRTPPEPTRDFFCGCDDTCSLAVWKSETETVDFLSCEARVTWVQTHTEATSETAACRVVAEDFPSSECGQLCNPRTCNANNGPPDDRVCGCLDCTDEILARPAGDGATCGSRMQWLQSFEGGSYSEVDACSMVAGEQYPDVCGPQCDPSRCDGQSPPPPTPTPPPEDPPVCSGVTTSEVFGKNVWLMNDSMSTATIRGIFDCLLERQVNKEMGSERYSIFFLPGTYGSASDPLNVLIGYYTEVAGLGATPQEVVINGKIEVYNRCFVEDLYTAGKFNPTSAEAGGICFALNNFWRSLSNLSINIVHAVGEDDCRRTAMFYAISQASSMRRVDIRGGDLSLMDYCSEPGFASGGFIADVRHTGSKIINGSQQQFLARNSVFNKWSGTVWNNVFMGVQGAPDSSSYPNPPVTTFPNNPLSREKPFLFSDGTDYFVFVPSLDSDSRGVSWDAGLSLFGITLPLSDFFLAQPTDSVSEINTKLAEGQHLILLPGVYEVAESILVQRSDTVILGLGLATLKANQGSIPLKIEDHPGVIISGLTIDAGNIESPVLLQVGDPADIGGGGGDPANPITLHDIYFRVGGPYVGKANIGLEVNSNHVLIDHCWIWRADHGIEDFDFTDGFAGDNQRWREVIGRTGVVVNGDDVTATGLFVEHFQEDNLVWNGERGRVFFFQNELPYDPPSQDDWSAERVGYKVNDSVQVHELWGGGVYCYNRNNPSIVTNNGFSLPPGARKERLYTRNLSGPGTILSVVNGIGRPVTSENEGPEYVVVA